MPARSAQVVVDEATAVLPLAGLIDVGAERAQLEREHGRAAGEVEKIARKLANADFVRRAPAEVVEETAENEVARLEAASDTWFRKPS